MIYDSNIWKRDLKTELRKFQAFIKTVDLGCDEEESDVDDESDINNVFIRLQKFVIYTSIIIRKMLECQRISGQLEQTDFTVFVHDKISTKSINKLSFCLDKPATYDLENSRKVF